MTASGVAPGLAIGDRAPDFTLPNAVDQPVRLVERLTGGPVVLSFYRGEWCPFYNIELRALQSWLPRFASHGASVIAVSPQSADNSLSVAEKHSLAFEVLSDVHQEVIRAYRVHYTAPATRSNSPAPYSGHCTSRSTDAPTSSPRSRLLRPPPCTYRPTCSSDLPVAERTLWHTSTTFVSKATRNSDNASPPTSPTRSKFRSSRE